MICDHSNYCLQKRNDSIETEFQLNQSSGMPWSSRLNNAVVHMDRLKERRQNGHQYTQALASHMRGVKRTSLELRQEAS